MRARWLRRRTTNSDSSVVKAPTINSESSVVKAQDYE